MVHMGKVKVFINYGLETVVIECFVYMQIHARAECTMNERFCILHEAGGAEFSIENFEFIVHSASACICKQNTNLTVSNTFNI